MRPNLWFMMLQNQCVGNRRSPGPRCCGAVYLSLSACDLANSSSHICGSWYLPIFLFRDGPLTLIRIASLMDLTMVLSANNAEIFNEKVMTNGVVVVMDGWVGPCVFSEPFYKSSAWLLYVFFFTVHPTTLESVNQPTFVEDGVSVLGVYQEVLDGAVSFEMHFNTMFPADVLTALTHSFNIGHHHVGLIVVEVCVVPDVAGILVGSVGILLFDTGPDTSTTIKWCCWENIFLHTWWSQCWWLGESLCLTNNLFCFNGNPDLCVINR